MRLRQFSDLSIHKCFNRAVEILKVDYCVHIHLFAWLSYSISHEAVSVHFTSLGIIFVVLVRTYRMMFLLIMPIEETFCKYVFSFREIV